MPKRAAVFVDRDNTLIHDPGYLRHADHVRLLAGVGEAVHKLRTAGFPVVVVTNQSGIARGYLTEQELAAVHQRMQELLQASGSGVDAIYFCPYLTGPDAVVEEYCKDSEMRKPRPGMLLQAAADLNLDLNASWMVGDSERDILAGQAAGCRTIFIGNGNLNIDALPDFTAASFSKAAEIILRETKARAAKSAATEASSSSTNAGSGRSNAASKSTAPPGGAKSKNRDADVGLTPRGNEGGVAVANPPAVRVADPHVRILEPSAAAARRNIVEPGAEAAPKPVRPTADAPTQPAAKQGSASTESEARPDKAAAAPPRGGDKPLPQKAPSSAPAAIEQAAPVPAPAVMKPALPEIPRPAPVEPVATVQTANPTPAMTITNAAAAGPSTQAAPAAAPSTTTSQSPLHEFPTSAPEPTLGQVLEELRTMRREQRYKDFSFSQLAGAIFQAFAVCALAFALYGAMNDDAAAATFRVLLAIAFQLMALTGFLVGRKN